MCGYVYAADLTTWTIADQNRALLTSPKAWTLAILLKVCVSLHSISSCNVGPPNYELVEITPVTMVICVP